MQKLSLALALLALIAVGVIGAKVYKPETLGTYRLNLTERVVMNEVATSTVGTTIGVADYRNFGITVATTAASGTLKMACSGSDNEPTFSSAQSVSNRWDYIQIIDLENAEAIDGDTGLTFENSTDVRRFEVNDNSSKWCTVITSSWTSGTSTVTLLPANNQ